MRERLGKKKPFICAKIMDMHDEENERFKEVYRGISDEQVIDVPWNIAGLEENSLDKLYGADGEKAHEEYLDTSLYKETEGVPLSLYASHGAQQRRCRRLLLGLAAPYHGGERAGGVAR